MLVILKMAVLISSSMQMYGYKQSVPNRKCKNRQINHFTSKKSHLYKNVQYMMEENKA